MPPTLLSVPSKLLQAIADQVSFEHDLNALAQSHPRLEEILAPYIKARKDRQERSKFLIFAIKSSKPPQLCQLLLRDGADPTVRVEMEQGKTALHFAAETGQTVVARVLLAHQHSLLDIRDRIGRTPLMCAAEGGHEAVVRTLRSTKYGPADVTLRDCKNRSALWYAAYGGNVTIVQMLLDTGKLDPNSADSDGLTPFACAAREGDCEMMRLLLSEGADPDYRAHLGKTPLYLAAGNGREEAVQYLLALSREAAWILTQKLSMGKRRYERQPGEVIRVLSSSSWG
jgi:ankyrin repeat protein